MWLSFQARVARTGWQIHLTNSVSRSPASTFMYASACGIKYSLKSGADSPSQHMVFTFESLINKSKSSFYQHFSCALNSIHRMRLSNWIEKISLRSEDALPQFQSSFCTVHFTPLKSLSSSFYGEGEEIFHRFSCSNGSGKNVNKFQTCWRVAQNENWVDNSLSAYSAC